jgi:hypothetical protein
MPSVTGSYPIASHPKRSRILSTARSGHPTCHAYFSAGATGFILKSKRELQLQIPVLPKVRHRDRRQRDCFLIGVFSPLPSSNCKPAFSTAIGTEPS